MAHIEFTPESRFVWLSLAREGGWWTVKAIVHFWHPTFAECEVEGIVRALVAGHFLARREVMPGEASYAVTGECMALPGADLRGTEWRQAA